MKKCFFLPLLLLIAIALQGQSLAPQERASLRAHMLEINAEWSHMAPEADWLDAEIAFKDDRSRIQTHLNLVVNTLRQRQPEGMSSDAIQQRIALLDELQAYAQRGLFPENSKHDVRIPYFIDHKGVACAVGFLMIRSGSQEVATKVRDEMNQAYMREIPYDALPQWAAEKGFTKNELAWIQPGYPPSTNYKMIGEGTDSTVTAIIVDPYDNSLILAGHFSNAGGLACNGVARWDGTAFQAFGNGLDGDVHALAYHNGELYAGGSFSGSPAPTNIARWDGQAWNYSATSQNGTVTSLLDFNDTLYASTDAGLVSVLENGSWKQFAIPFNGPVYTLTDFNGDLVAGGGFSKAEGDTILYVAKFNGRNWAPFQGEQMDNMVYSLHDHHGDLYAGGKLFNDSMEASMGLARLGSKGWEMALDTVNDFGARSLFQSLQYYPEPNPNLRIMDLASYKNTLVLSGKFMVVNGLTYGNGLAALLNNTARLIPTVAIGEPVMALANYDTLLAFGGDLPYWGNQEKGNIFYTDLRFSFNSIEERSGLSIDIGPQPMKHRAHIRGLPERSVELQLVDIQGRKTPMRYSRDGSRATLFRDGQAPGVYILKILQNGATLGATKLVME